MRKSDQEKLLTDDSPMPFGKHEGRAMIDVPAPYLLWLADQEWIEEWPRVCDYIEDNMHVLEHELKYGR